MRYVSLFSGIEAASVAWHPLGWEPLAFAEIEPFPCAVLAERFPDVPNLGDVSQVDWSPYRGRTDVLVGGSPCQSFSVAGNRGGLDDPRGQLMLEYVRAVRDIGPKWVVWENVPGVLSQDGGRAFATLLRELSECGLSLAWRVLDAQFWGVAQRRRRVFVVGGPTGASPAAVLFEPGSVPGGSGASRSKREEVARAAGERAGGEGELGPVTFPWANGGKADMAPLSDLSPTITAHPFNTPAVAFAQNERDEVRLVNGDGQIAGALSEHPGIKQQTFVCMTDTQANALIDGEVCGALSATMHKDPPVAAYAMREREGKAGGGKGPLLSEDVSLTLLDHCDQTVFVNSDGTGIAGALCAFDYKAPNNQYVDRGKLIACDCADGWVVRRLTPVECERLQGFPDGWTDIPGAKDGQRYKAIGNSMAVPVMRWIGERIDEVDQLVNS